MDDNYDFNLDELSLLFLTNEGTGPVPQEFSNEKTFVLTTKETYIWGIIISRIVQKNPEVSEEQVISVFRKAIQLNKKYISRHYSELQFHPFSFPEPYFHNERFFYLMINTMMNDFGLELDTVELYTAQKKAFDSLVKSKHIEDPIFTTIFGLSVAIVGFIPYGFTKQTKKGRTVHRKIIAAFWSYEKKETAKDNVTTKINFRLWKVLTAFKKALAETTSEEIDQPDNNDND
jgi:hypothetical protein